MKYTVRIIIKDIFEVEVEAEDECIAEHKALELLDSGELLDPIVSGTETMILDE